MKKKISILFSVIALMVGMAACNGGVNTPDDGNGNGDGRDTVPGDSTINPPAGDAIVLNYKLTEFEGDHYNNRGYCYNVIFTTPGTDFEVNEVEVGGQQGFQYILNKGTAYMIYVISDQVRSQVPEPGTYTIGWYDGSDSEYEAGEDYGRRGTFARGYNAAANMPGVDQHAPVGSYKMNKPEEGEYMVDYFDDQVYSYVRDGELKIIENENGTYTWKMTLKFNDLTTENLTWTGKYIAK